VVKKLFDNAQTQQIIVETALAFQNGKREGRPEILKNLGYIPKPTKFYYIRLVLEGSQQSAKGTTLNHVPPLMAQALMENQLILNHFAKQLKMSNWYPFEIEERNRPRSYNITLNNIADEFGFSRVTMDNSPVPTYFVLITAMSPEEYGKGTHEKNVKRFKKFLAKHGYEVASLTCEKKEVCREVVYK